MYSTRHIQQTSALIIAKQNPAMTIKHVRDLQVAVADVPEGSVVQLHVRDPHWARHNILKQIQVPFGGFFGTQVSFICFTTSSCCCCCWHSPDLCYC
jgi:hypothetical protein